MQFKAMGVDSEFYRFKIEDCPVILNMGIMALTAKPGSKLLRIDTVVRGSDNNIFEGDRVLYKGGYFGYVVYAGGFKVRCKDTGELVDIPYGKNFRISKGTKRSIGDAVRDEDRSWLSLKVKDDIFELNGIVCSYRQSSIAITTVKCQERYVKPEDVRCSTGIEKEGNTLFFGDEYMGGKVIMKNGIPVVCLPDNRLLRLTK